MKYVICGNTPVLFPDCISHDKMAKLLSEVGRLGEVTGAGFCSFDEGGSVCVYGESVTLKMHSKDSDERLIGLMCQL